MALERYSLDELREAVKRFNETVQRASEERAKNEGPGWDPVFDSFERSRRELDDEISRRIAESTL